MMNKSIKNILFILTGFVGIYIFWITYKDIQKSNQQYLTIQGIDEKVIDKLIMGKELQTHYLSVKGEYARQWDSLFNFVRKDSIYMTQQKETIIKRQYGGDSISIIIDTIGVIGVYDSLKNQLQNIPLANIESIKYAPGHPQDASIEFFINAGKVKGVQVFEISDPKPINPVRLKPKNKGGLPPLQIGSMRSPSTKGNWEF